VGRVALRSKSPAPRCEYPIFHLVSQPLSPKLSVAFFLLRFGTQLGEHGPARHVRQVQSVPPACPFHIMGVEKHPGALRLWSIALRVQACTNKRRTGMLPGRQECVADPCQSQRPPNNCCTRPMGLKATNAKHRHFVCNQPQLPLHSLPAGEISHRVPFMASKSHLQHNLHLRFKADRRWIEGG